MRRVRCRTGDSPSQAIGPTSQTHSCNGECVIAYCQDSDLPTYDFSWQPTFPQTVPEMHTSCLTQSHHNISKSTCPFGQTTSSLLFIALKRLWRLFSANTILLESLSQTHTLPVSAYRHNILSCRHFNVLINFLTMSNTFLLKIVSQSLLMNQLQTSHLIAKQTNTTDITVLACINSAYCSSHSYLIITETKSWGTESLGPLSLILSLSSNSLGECLLATQSQSLRIGASISLLPTSRDYAWYLNNGK